MTDILWTFDVDYTLGGDGQGPLLGLVKIGTKLYGVTSGLRVGRIDSCIIYSYDIETHDYSILHTFGSVPNDGNTPICSLINVNGTLYGTTSAGGNNTTGTIFSYEISSSNYQKLYDFDLNGINGANPVSGLVNVNGTLYGTTIAGGNNTTGTIFSYEISSSNYQKLYNFGSIISDGASPQSGLINVNGTLYGTTSAGGNNTTGTIFSYEISNSSYHKLYDFGSIVSDGANPQSGLVNVNGTLYGTTNYGGKLTIDTINGDGVLFKFDINANANNYSILHNFGSVPNDGSLPQTVLINYGNKLYGTTTNGGSNSLSTAAGGFGTLFSINPSSAGPDYDYNILYNFGNTNTNNDSINPITDFLLIGNKLYGTSYSNLLLGGLGGDGTIYSYTLPLEPVPGSGSNGLGLENIPISNICFPADTLILTDQGNIEISKINPSIHSINNNKIIAITKTKSLDEYLVCFDKDAIFTNYPSEKTMISKDHKLYYKGKMIEAYKFIGHNNKVTKVRYNGEPLYNVLLDKYSIMNVNNLICETLDPENLVAKLYSGDIDNTRKNKLIKKITDISHTNKKANSGASRKILININQ